MRFFTKYSLVANVVPIVVVISAMLYISTKALDGGGDPDKFSPAEKVQLTAFDFHYNKYDTEGDLTVNFVSDKLEQYVNQDVKMTNLTEKSYDEKTGEQTWQVKSKYGFSKKLDSQNLIHLYDGVDAIMFSKKDNKANNKTSGDNADDDKYSPEKVYIKTSEMFYNTDSKDFYNSRFVRMYDPETGNNTTGIGVKGNSDSKVIKLNKDVRSYYASS